MPSGTIIMPSGTIWPDFLPKLASVAPVSPAARGGVMRGSGIGPRRIGLRGRPPGDPAGRDRQGGAAGANLASFGKKSGQMVPDGINAV